MATDRDHFQALNEYERPDKKHAKPDRDHKPRGEIHQVNFLNCSVLHFELDETGSTESSVHTN